MDEPGSGSSLGKTKPPQKTSQAQPVPAAPRGFGRGTGVSPSSTALAESCGDCSGERRFWKSLVNFLSNRFFAFARMKSSSRRPPPHGSPQRLLSRWMPRCAVWPPEPPQPLPSSGLLSGTRPFRRRGRKSPLRCFELERLKVVPKTVHLNIHRSRPKSDTIQV